MKVNSFVFFTSLLFGCLPITDVFEGSDTINNYEPLAHRNIVVILVDDLGWKDLGCYGSTSYDTPNIDGFAANGALYTNAYANSPVCSPSRASILVGKHPSRMGINNWFGSSVGTSNNKMLTPENAKFLPHSEITIAERLGDHGYLTFFAGKWHLGGSDFSSLPEDHGFDINYGGINSGSPPGGYYSPYLNPKLSDGPKTEYLTDRLTSETISFIRENRDSPFFVFLSFYNVHLPLEGNKEFLPKYLDKFKSDNVKSKVERNSLTVLNQTNALYGSMIEAVDKNVGRILGIINELELEKNTTIILTSDNGPLTTRVKSQELAPTSVHPLRAGKGWCYEGGLRIPLIIKTPEKWIGKYDLPIMLTDLYPTILDLTNISLDYNQHKDGLSLISDLSKFKNRTMFWNYPNYHGSGWAPGAAIRNGKWKLIELYHWKEIELYNLEADIGEEQNVASYYPEKVDSLRKKLRLLQSETNCKLAEWRR